MMFCIVLKGANSCKCLKHEVGYVSSVLEQFSYVQEVPLWYISYIRLLSNPPIIKEPHLQQAATYSSLMHLLKVVEAVAAIFSLLQPFNFPYWQQTRHLQHTSVYHSFVF